jgi:hypothetical protein
MIHFNASGFAIQLHVHYWTMDFTRQLDSHEDGSAESVQSVSEVRNQTIAPLNFGCGNLQSTKVVSQPLTKCLKTCSRS